MKHYFSVLITLFLVFPFLGSAENLHQKGHAAYRKGEVVVRMKADMRFSDMELRWQRKRQAVGAVGKEETIRIPLRTRRLPGMRRKHDHESRAETVLMTYGDDVEMEQLLKQLRADPYVDVAEPNYTYRLNYLPNDPRYPEQTALTQIGFPQGWVTSAPQQGSGQVIAIIDTGCDTEHEDLVENIWVNPGEIPGNGVDDDGNGFIDDMNGWSFVNDGHILEDQSGHGTHVAGIAAAVSDNGLGVAGVAPNAKIMVLKVFQADGTASMADIIASVDYARISGATVINMSFGGPYSQLLEDALAQAHSQAILVAAAGNAWGDSFRPPPPTFPASLSFVIAVGASDSQGQSAPFSNQGEVYAPGVSILSSLPGDRYAAWAGTSMASPIVSGIAALYAATQSSGSSGLHSAQIIRSASTPISNPKLAGEVVGYRVDVGHVFSVPAQPDVVMESHTVSDPSPEGNNDGLPDAGETVLLDLVLRNQWSSATNVTANLISLDPIHASVIDGTCDFGNIGSFASKRGSDLESVPFSVNIASNTAHALKIPFDLEWSYDGLNETRTNRIFVQANRANSVSGHLTNDTTWTSDRIWRLADTTFVDAGVTLFIEAGTTVLVDPGKALVNQGLLRAIGTAENYIRINGKLQIDSSALLQFCDFRGLGQGSGAGSISYTTAMTVENCIFADGASALVNGNRTIDIQARRNVFYGYSTDYPILNFRNGRYTENLFVGNHQALSFFYGPIIQNNIFQQNGKHLVAISSTISGQLDVSSNYFGGETIEEVLEHTVDIHDHSGKLEFLLPANLPQLPSDIPSNCPPVVAEVKIDSALPLATGPHALSVSFSKSMDTNHTPFVAFGVSEPYTQHPISGAWSNETTWVGRFTVNRFVEDGTHRLYVAGPVDQAYRMPIFPDTRFEFRIEAADVQTVGLQANPGPGTIDLSWGGLSALESVGVNVYRSSTQGGPYSKVNGPIVTEFLYSDSNVVEGVTYYYTVREVTSSLKESPDSSEVSAIPGDATPPLILHTPPASLPGIGDEPYVVATLSDNIGVTGGLLYYRVGSSGSFSILAMENTVGDLWRAQLPAATAAGYEYYLAVSDGISTTWWHSEHSPYALPVEGAPNTGFSATPSSGNAPMFVQFADESLGDPISWQWDFNNDGTVDSNLQNPSHVYSVPGTYSVRLVTNNDQGGHAKTMDRYIRVYESLEAAFSAGTTSGTSPFTIQFFDQSSGAPTGWVWDLDGDEQPDSTERNPTFQYTSVGVYSVSLTVTSPNASDTETKTGFITVSADGGPPQANFRTSVTEGLPGTAVTFTDLSGGNATSWSWDFDNDGIVDSVSQNPTHVFTRPGSYSVKLVSGNDNGTNSLVRSRAIVIYDTSIAYQGRLTLEGQKVSGLFDMRFRLFEQFSGGAALWQEERTDVPVDRGIFGIYLGDGVPIPQAVVNDSSALYLELEVFHEAEEAWYTLSPRLRVAASPRARKLIGN